MLVEKKVVKKMIPAILKSRTADDYLTAAVETAAWIDTLSVPTEYGKIWKALPDGQDGYREDVPMFTPKSLYDGSAGIGIFFIRLYEATQDRKWLNEAEAAAAHILATAAEPEWYEKTLNSPVKGIIPVPGWAAGSSNGPVGEAYFLEDLYQVTGDKKYRDFVLKTADDLLLALKNDESGYHWSDQQDVVGDGGSVVFLILLYRKTGIKRYLDAAERVMERTAADAMDSPYGGKFWKLLDLSLIDFPKDTTFPNWSHGTTGISWVFAALYQDTGNRKYLDLARSGLEYAMNISVGDETGRLIPYQDHPVTGPTWDRYYLSTCHGPAGSSLAFRLMYEITKEEQYRNFTIELSRGILKAGAPEQHSWGYWNCMCQCCGLAGILEHFAHMTEFTNSDEFKNAMLRSANVLLSNSDHRTPGSRTWYDSWWRTIPTRVVSYPGLYVGAAGCASALLKTYAVLNGRKLTNLYEYHFFETAKDWN